MCHPHLTLYSFFSFAADHRCAGTVSTATMPAEQVSVIFGSSCWAHRTNKSTPGSLLWHQCENSDVLEHQGVRLKNPIVCAYMWAGFTDLLLCGREKQTQKTVEIFSFTLFWPMGAATIWTRPKIFLKKGGLTKKETFTNTTSYLCHIKLPRTVWDLLCRHFYKHFL